MTNLENWSVSRVVDETAPDNIHPDSIQKLRAYHACVTEQDVFRALGQIGLETICDIISQGYTLHDVATGLSVPITTLDNWLGSDSAKQTAYAQARRLSAQLKVAKAKSLVMNVRPADRDEMAVAKAKADHLKWEATRDDPEGYGDRVKHDGAQTAVQFNITLGDRCMDVHELTKSRVVADE